jgi:hypothetical protein
MIPSTVLQAYYDRVNQLVGGTNAKHNVITDLMEKMKTLQMRDPALARQIFGLIQGYCWVTDIFSWSETEEFMRQCANPLATLPFAVAGISHHALEYAEAKVKPGDEMSLELEPTNAHDRDAIKVLKGTHHIGYVSKSDVSKVRAYMAAYKGRLVVIAADEHNCALNMECLESRGSVTT